MRITLRAAAESDVALVGELWKSMVKHHRDVVGGAWPVRSADDSWARRREQYSSWLAEESGFILLAEGENRKAPIGYLACRLLGPGPTFDLGELRGDVDSLVVAETARGQGVGTALLGACREELRRRGARYWSIGVVEANSDAVQLYERVGFRSFVRSMLTEIDPAPERSDAADAG